MFYGDATIYFHGNEAPVNERVNMTEMEIIGLANL